MKIAVCISGQLRDWMHPHESIVRLLEELDGDVYMHVWDKAGRTSAYDRLLGSTYLSSLLIPREPDGTWRYDHALWERLPSLYDLFYNTTGIDRGALERKYEPTALVLETEPKWKDERTLHGVHFPEALDKFVSLRHINSLPMFYKIWAADALAREFGDYDVVVRLRLDVVISDVESVLRSIHNASPDTVYLPQTNSSSFANDMFAFGRGDAMRRYAAIWKKLPDYWNLKKYPELPARNRTAERLLYFHLKSEKLAIEFLKARCTLDPSVTAFPEADVLRAIESDLVCYDVLKPSEERAVCFLRERLAARVVPDLPERDRAMLLTDLGRPQSLGPHRLPPLHHVCGKVAEQNEDFGVALYHLERAFASYKAFWPDPGNDYARVLRNTKRIPEAIGVLSELCSRFPRAFFPWRDLGMAYHALWKENSDPSLVPLIRAALDAASTRGSGEALRRLKGLRQKMGEDFK